MSRVQNALVLLNEIKEAFNNDVMVRLLAVGAKGQIDTLEEAQELLVLLGDDRKWMLKLNSLFAQPSLRLSRDGNQSILEVFLPYKAEYVELKRYGPKLGTSNIPANVHIIKDHDYFPNNNIFIANLYPFFNEESFIFAPSNHITFCNKAQTPSSSGDGFLMTNDSSLNRMGQYAISKGNYELNQMIGCVESYCIGVYTAVGYQEEKQTYQHIIRFFMAGSLDSLSGVIRERLRTMLKERRAAWPQLKKYDMYKLYRELWQKASWDLTNT